LKHILGHIKASGIMSGSGMVSYAGGQYLNTAITESLWRSLALFLLFTCMGVISKLVLDKVSKK
jgi:hypothetical protein